MKERPIIFSAPSVRAILAGRKTMTRRPVKLPEIISEPGDADATSIGWIVHHESGPGWHGWMTEYPEEGSLPLRCPYGDRLWVRETWAPKAIDPECTVVAYRATDDACNGPWRTSSHMPRWASRITLEITGVRVERLQGISSDDCIAEGIGDPVGAPLRYGSITEAWNRRAFQQHWESINGPGSWAENPWVWVLSFKRVMS